MAIDPITISAGVSMAGSALGAIGGAKAGDANARIAEYNARIDERNARVAEIQARHLGHLSKADAIQDQRDLAREIGGIDAHYSAGGVQEGTGTALTVALENARRADEQIANDLYNAKVEQLALKERAVGYRLKGGITRAEGIARKRAAKTAAIGSFLSTAGSVGMRMA